MLEPFKARVSLNAASRIGPATIARAYPEVENDLIENAFCGF